MVKDGHSLFVFDELAWIVALSRTFHAVFFEDFFQILASLDLGENAQAFLFGCGCRQPVRKKGEIGAVKSHEIREMLRGEFPRPLRQVRAIPISDERAFFAKLPLHGRKVPGRLFPGLLRS